MFKHLLSFVLILALKLSKITSIFLSLILNFFKSITNGLKKLISNLKILFKILLKYCNKDFFLIHNSSSFW